MYSDNAIGLVRTEHMILSHEDSLKSYKKALLQQDETALETIRRTHADEFKEILWKLDDDYPIKVRLSDMPPSECFNAEERTQYDLHYGEGTRGIQLAEQFPELYEAQLHGIFEGLKANDIEEEVPVDIMVPTVRHGDELRMVKSMVERIADEHGFDNRHYRFGSMIETLEACENIEDIIQECDFISIGSNDLTSEIMECHRDDFAKRRKLTIASGLNEDPFIVMHANVLNKIEDVVARARAVKPDIHIDLCGEHGANLNTLMRLHPIELSGVSMSPTRENLSILPILYDNALFQRKLEKTADIAEDVAIESDVGATQTKQLQIVLIPSLLPQIATISISAQVGKEAWEKMMPKITAPL